MNVDTMIPEMPINARLIVYTIAADKGVAPHAPFQCQPLHLLWCFARASDPHHPRLAASLDHTCSRVGTGRRTRSSLDICPSRCLGMSRYTELELLPVRLWEEVIV
jgi:hypothetical protein